MLKVPFQPLRSNREPDVRMENRVIRAIREEFAAGQRG
jgi:hypothetical protein